MRTLASLAIGPILGLSLLAVLAACADVSEPVPALPETETLSFETFVGDVQPILLRRCATPGCHGDATRPFALYGPGFHRKSPNRRYSQAPLTADEVRFNYDRSRSFSVPTAGGALLLTKPLSERLGGVSHGHGIDIFISRDDREYKTLAAWLGVKPAREAFVHRDLTPYPNPFVGDPRYRPGPERVAPGAMALSSDGKHVHVVLQGSVDRPGYEVLTVDLDAGNITTRHRVGSSPTGLAISPDGAHLVVTNRFSNYLSVITLATGRVTHFEADFYGVDVVFSFDADRLFVANRWKNAVQSFDVLRSGEDLVLRDRLQDIPVGFNPEKLLLSPDGRRLFVVSPAALKVAVVAIEEDRMEVVAELSPGAPPTSVTLVADRLYVTTLSESTHHPPENQGGGYGFVPPTEGTPNQGFSALQNELAVYALDDPALDDPALVARYTSDSYCCLDPRDVSPEDPDLGHLVPEPSTWLVAGALPEASTAYSGPEGKQLYVVYSGSSELQRFDILDDGSLYPGPVLETGFDPRHIVIDEKRDRAVVSNRLGESLTIVDLEGFAVTETVVLRDQDRPFPATDVELGELVFFSGAAFSIDGDQTCNHCHRDRGNIGKAFSLPHLANPMGSRMTMATRGLFDARPWFIEGAMDENTFIDEHHMSREAFSHAAGTLVGRERSFGDVLDVALDFDGVAALVGLFLIHDPALLPNPNVHLRPAVERGRLLFHSPETGCVFCHPPPSFAVTPEHNPFGMPLRFGPVISPNRTVDGRDLDRVSTPFLAQFPGVLQSDSDLFMKAPILAGLWDRAPGFYHDGRAPTLRAALATPGHEALGPDEPGYNETDGIFDSHGGTSHLTAEQLEDLIEFLLSL